MKAVARAATPKRTAEDEAAAYQRGWDDGMRAYWALSLQPIADRFAYNKGWHDAADHRLGRNRS